MRWAPYRKVILDALDRVGFEIETRDDFIAADELRATVGPLFGERIGKELLP